jgi:hypothetical protein
MWGSLLFDAAMAAMLIVLWYFGWREFNRRQGLAIVGSIQKALAGKACVSAPRWQGASRFSVQLRFPSAFRESSLAVGLTPREMPLNWLLARWKKQKEWILFQAELERRPSANLVISSHRWIGRTNPRSQPPESCYSLGSLVVTTREDWNTETALIETLLATRAHEFAHVEFRQKAPHVLLTAPLDALCPDTNEASLFDLLQELASCASGRTASN